MSKLMSHYLTSYVGDAEDSDGSGLDDAALVGQEGSSTKVTMGAWSTTVGHVALVIVGLTGLLCHDCVSQRRVLGSNITITSLSRVS